MWRHHTNYVWKWMHANFASEENWKKSSLFLFWTYGFGQADSIPLRNEGGIIWWDVLSYSSCCNEANQWFQFDDYKLANAHIPNSHPYFFISIYEPTFFILTSKKNRFLEHMFSLWSHLFLGLTWIWILPGKVWWHTNSSCKF